MKNPRTAKGGSACAECQAQRFERIASVLLETTECHQWFPDSFPDLPALLSARGDLLHLETGSIERDALPNRLP
jgi:hypothetical protein